MADENKTINSLNTSFVDYVEVMGLTTEETLKSIELTLRSIARQDGIAISQSTLKDMEVSERNAAKRAARDASDPRYKNNTSGGRSNNTYTRGSSSDFIGNDTKKRGKMTFDRMMDEFEEGFNEAIFGVKDPFKMNMTKVMEDFAKSLGTTLEDLPKTMGKRAAGQLKLLDFRNILGGPFKNQGNIINNFLGTNRSVHMNVAEQWKAETDYLKGTANKIVGSGFNSLSKALGGTGVDVSAFDLFAEDRSEESPKNKDIDEIVTRNTDRIVGSQYTNREDIIDVIDAVINNSDRDDVIDSLGDVASDSAIDAAESALKLPASLDQLTDLGGNGTDLISNVLGSANEGALGTGLQAISKYIPSVAKGFGEMLPAFGGAAASVEMINPPLLVLHASLIAATMMVDALSDAMKPAIEGFKSLIGGISNAANRQTTANAKYLELQKERMKADAKTLKEAAFDVIKDSANKVQEVWSSVLTTVSATQGYDKAGVQELWGGFAQRLKDNNLASVISSADIMEKLQSVLQQGLSGAVAEEFAYQATILNNAIPTEDFFQYASTYASIAANAIKNGMSQADALTAANNELLSFANNLLYASREVAGGFTTSLSNASSLFEQSAKIVQASRIGTIQEISGVLTSASAIIGATAPDLASGIVDAIVNAATGGNSSEITALRSLAGTGASNTAFLQAFARNPQQVFSTLFSNLAQLQNMSSSNYMEVAEALSSVFGMSLDTFARVDFDYLAQAISQMNVNSDALNSNMELLVAGETTANDAQLRMQKINEYMIDQGLAYVLDNEVARSIQEHMWQEQLAREIEESTFAVELKGSALDFLNGIVTTVTKIGDLLTLGGWVKKINNVALTALEGAAQSADLAQILQRGKVGTGNAIEFGQLTTIGENLHLTPDYLTLMGGTSMSGMVQGMIGLNNTLFSSNATNLAMAVQHGSNILGTAVTDIAGSLAAGINPLNEIVAKSSAAAKSAGTMANSFYKTAIISKKQVQQLSSGDWRTNKGFDALLQNYTESGTDDSGPKTQKEANTLSEKISQSIKSYIASNTEQASKIDELRSTITEANDLTLVARDRQALEEAKSLEHRSYFTQAELTKAVAEEIERIGEEDSQGSFEEWVKKFQRANGIGNLGALLSDFGETLETVRSMYEQEEAAKSNAEAKALQLHEVQFWEDMQNFVTNDAPAFFREWERYYIQHEAYTKATDNAYGEAVKLEVEEKGELGDSVLALAKALTENNMWQEEKLDAIKDPTIQTNALLAKILLTVEAIMQQNNETSIVSVPTALSSLGLGVSNI